MGRKAQQLFNGTCSRAIEHWLSISTPIKRFCAVENGHVYTGTESQHLTKSGCGYRALVRMRIRLGLSIYRE